MEPEQTAPSAAPETVATPEVIPWDQVKAALDHHLANTPEAKEELRAHNFVAGVAGEVGSRIANRQLEQQRADAAARAIADQEAELLKLADEDPEAFAERFKSERTAERALQQLRGVKMSERRQVAAALGRAVADMPELRNATKDDLAGIAAAITGVPEEQVIPRWHKAVVDLAARKRAEALAEERLSTRLKSEREVWEAESKAKQIQRTAAPSLRTGGTNGAVSDEPADFNSPEWAAWYKKEHGIK